MLEFHINNKEGHPTYNNFYDAIKAYKPGISVIDLRARNVTANTFVNENFPRQDLEVDFIVLSFIGAKAKEQIKWQDPVYYSTEDYGYEECFRNERQDVIVYRLFWHDGRRTWAQDNITIKMRKCSTCGKELDIFDEQEKFNWIYHNIGYGSKHDGETLRYSFCCDCADKITDFIQNMLPTRGISASIEEEFNMLVAAFEKECADELKHDSDDDDDSADDASSVYHAMQNSGPLAWFDKMYDCWQKEDKMPESMKNLFDDLGNGSISLNSAKEQASEYYHTYVEWQERLTADGSDERQAAIKDFMDSTYSILDH